MDAVFARDSGSLFPSDPVPKTFYCPTTPCRLSRHEQMTTLTPTHPPTTHTPPHKLHWDIVCTSTSSAVGTSDTVLSTSGSSRFNESWPSNSEVEGVSTRDGSGNVVSNGGNKEETKNEEMTGSRGTLAKYIERFRRAPPTSRNTRNTPSRPFWWKQNHATSPGDHVTPPREPQDHSTPDSQKTASYTEPSPRVSTDTSRRPDPDGSLETRSQELIDKSSSLLSGGSDVSSIPAQKYFNTQSDRTQETVRSVRVTGATLRGTSLCPGALLDPSEDILYRWRLKRKLELARREAAMVNTESKQFHTTTSSSLTVPPHSHRSCDILPCTRRENQHQFDSYRNNETSESRTYVSANEPVTATRCAHHTRDHPLQTCHSSLLEPTSHSCTCVGTYDKIQTEGDVPNPVSPCQPDSGQSSSLHSRSGKRLKKELQSSIKQLSNDGHIGPDQAKRPTNGCNSQPVVSEPQVPSTVRSAAIDPPSPPCHRDVEEEDDDNDISLSNFSLNFTTEIDQTPQTNKEGQGTRTKGNMGPVVSQVVRNRLFGTPLSSSVTSTPPHTAVPLYTASSSDETLSKAKVATSEVVEGREAPEIPWDCHMDDDLLKMLITKAKLFEEQINNIDGLLSAMATY